MHLLSSIFTLFALFSCSNVPSGGTTSGLTTGNDQNPSLTVTDATLAELTLSEGTLSPEFSPSVMEYDLSLEKASLTVQAKPTKSTSTLQIKLNEEDNKDLIAEQDSDELALATGANTLLIIVTAEDKTTKTYTINIDRTLSTNAKLSSLTISKGTLDPEFSADTKTYAAEVENSDTEVTFTPTSENDLATIQIKAEGGEYQSVASGNASEVFSLAEGLNKFEVLVTAEDLETTETYTLSITRAASTPSGTLSSVAELSNLTLSVGTLSPSFAEATTSYTASVGSTTASIDVTATSKNTHASLRIKKNQGTYSTITSGTASTINLDTGSQTITILSTAENTTTTKTYVITVTKAAGSSFSGVYISGRSTDSSNQTVPGYWHNGTWTALTPLDPTKLSTPLFMTSDDNHFYVAGNSFPSSGGSVAGYWQDGTWNGLPALDSSNPSGLFSLFVINSHVYAVGSSTNSSMRTVAGYWLDGTWNELSALDSTKNTSAVIGTYANGHLLIVGSSVNSSNVRVPGYWDNGSWTGLTPLDSTRDCSTRKIIIGASSQIHVLGNCSTSSNPQISGYWTNNTWTALTNSLDSTKMVMPTDIETQGSDLYVTGTSTNSSNVQVPGYWKNGTWTSLPAVDNTKPCFVQGIAFSGNDIYIAGQCTNSSNVTEAGYWLNGTWTALPALDSTKNSITMAIYIPQ